MKPKNDVSRNLVIYPLREGFFNAAMPMVNGALIQLFLAHQGVSAARIGLFTSIIYLVTLASTILASGIAEQKADPSKQCRRVIWLQAAFYLLFFPLALVKMDPFYVFLLVTLMASLQIVIYSSKVILGYKIPYQIITMDKYGPFSAFTGIAMGVVGMVMNYIYSAIIEADAAGNPYLLCMILAFGMMLISYALSSMIRPVNHGFDVQTGKPMRLGDSVHIFREPVFKTFIIPNAIRGITIGVTDSMALIALAMGLSEGSASRLPLMFSIGYIVSSFLYYLLPHWISVQKVGILGCVMLAAILFLPRGNDVLFLVLTFVAYVGRLLVDAAVPELVYRMISPDIAGAYNAWRGVLYNVVSVVTVYLLGNVVERVSPLFLLVPCVAAYAISMGWYCVMFKKFHGNWLK